MPKEHEVTYDRFKNVLSTKFGYENEVKRGFTGVADLIDSGAILDKDGNPLQVDRKKGEEELAKTIQSKLAAGEPLYIYFPGEQLPREVTYDPAKGFQVSDEPVSEPKKPEKEPSLFSKAFFQFFRVTGIMTKTYREWHEYNNKKELFKKVSDRKVIDNRRRNDKELRKSGDAYVKKDKTEITESLLGLVEDQLGYGAEMQSKGPSALLDLMAKGLVYDENGKPFTAASMGKSPKDDLVNSVGRYLEEGHHLYIYQKDSMGKSQPRELYYDWNKGKLVLSELKDLEKVQPAQAAPSQPQKNQPQQNQPTQAVQTAPPDPKTKSEMILEKLQKIQGGEPLSDQVKQNVEHICQNAQMGMEQLKNQLDSEKMIQGGDNIRYILLQNSLEKQVEDGKLMPSFMDTLKEEHGLEYLRRGADLSPAIKQMTSHKVDSAAFKPFVEGGQKLDTYTDQFLAGLGSVAAKAEGKTGKSMEDLLKGIDPKKAEKVKEQANKTAKKEDPKKDGPKKDAPKKEDPQLKQPKVTEKKTGGLGLS